MWTFVQLFCSASVLFKDNVSPADRHQDPIGVVQKVMNYVDRRAPETTQNLLTIDTQIN